MNSMTRCSLRASMTLAAKGMLSVEELACSEGRADDFAWFEMRLLLLRSRLSADVTGSTFVRDVRSFAIELEAFIAELLAD
jgi:hypothetical protein